MARTVESLHVLLVEDDPGDAGWVRELAEAEQHRRFTLDVCATLQEAIDVVQARAYDAILLDLTLPDSAGFETVQRMSSAAPLTPLIVLTGQDDIETTKQCIERGADDTLVKGRVGERIGDIIHVTVARAVAQRALREAHENLRRLLSDSQDAIVVLGPDNAVRYANQAAVSLLAERVEIGQDFGIPHPGELEVVVPGRAKTVVVEMRVGETVWHNESAQVVTFRDVTERARAVRDQLVAKQILERLNRAVEGDDALLEILHMIQDYAEVEAVGLRLRKGDNFPYHRTLGFPPAFVEREHSLFALDPLGEPIRTDGQAILECFCGHVLTQKVNSMLDCFTRFGSFHTNSTTDLLASITDAERLARVRALCNVEGYETVALVPLRFGDETIGLLQLNDRRHGRLSEETLGFLENIGASMGIALARKKAEDELRFRNLILSTQQETSIDGILVIDREGVVVSHNQQFVSMWGIPESTMQSKSGSQTMHFVLNRLVDPQEFKDRVRQLHLSPNEKTQDEVLLLDGRIFDRYSAPMIGADGVHFGRVWYFRDVTKHKHLQAQIAKSERLSSMGLLAAGLAHEINNPLFYVLYNLESLAADLPRVSSAAQRCRRELIEHFGEVRLDELLGEDSSALAADLFVDMQERFDDALDGSQRINHVARGLSSFSHVEEHQLAPMSLNQAIEAAINLAFNEIKYRARLIRDYGRTAQVLANKSQLSQVFLNLLVNAAHAIPEGRSEHNSITLRTYQDGDEVVAEVQDSGEGMPEEQLDHLFESLFSTRVRAGLGLTICKSIIDGYQGTIQVSSEVGKGSKFVVRLPCMTGAEADEARTPEARDDGEPRLRGRFLVVDDDAAVRRTIVRILGDCEVVEATDGSEAKRIIEVDREFELILCDIMMPVLSGVGFHEWLSSAYPELSARVVFITGGAFAPQARQYLAKVPNPRVDKPILTEDLRRVIREQVHLLGAR